MTTSDSLIDLDCEKLYHRIIQLINTGCISDAYRHLNLLVKVDPSNLQAQKLHILLKPRDPEIIQQQLQNTCSQKMLNLGCGRRFHPAWKNVNFTATGPGVIAHDLNQSIPFGDNSVDVVYHSHLLEHFTKTAAPRFIQQCYRVLKPSGILRVVVPNLESIARQYLRLLEQSLAGDVTAQKRYEWILLELFDQMVRNVSGGEMLAYWRQNPMPAEDFVYERVGSEARDAVRAIRAASRSSTTATPSPATAPDALGIGQFRLSGEIHQWMYDRYSLEKLLEATGFRDIRVCRADESRIPDFNSYLLDIEADGAVRKPDSLFMEAVKPDADIHFAADGNAIAQNPKVRHLIETTLTRARAALAAGQSETALRLLNSLDSLNLELPEVESLKRRARN